MEATQKTVKAIQPGPTGGQVARADRMAPHSFEAEEAVLGSLLINADLLDQVLKEHLETEHFFIVRNGWVFEAILKLRERGDEIDYVTVVEELRHQERLDDIGGAAYITYLINHTPPSIYASAYAAIVYRAAYRRGVLDVASELAVAAHAEASNISQVEAQVKEALDRLRLPGAADSGLRGTKAVDHYKLLLEQRNQGHKVYSTPFEALNKYVFGIQPGSFLILTGFTGSGKTALCEAFAEFYASEEKLQVCYIHTEVTIDRMLDRRTARHSGIPFVKLQKPNTMSQNERQLVDDALASTSTWSKLIDFKFVEKDPTQPGHLDSKRLVEYMRHEAGERGTKVFILDYFTDVYINTSKISLPQAYENFLYSLRRFTESTDSILIVSSQMSETPYGGRTRGTRMMDAKATLQLDIHTQKLESPYTYGGHTWEVGERSPEVKIWLPKNTFGPPEVEFTLFFDGPRFDWKNMSVINAEKSTGSDHWSDR